MEKLEQELQEMKLEGRTQMEELSRLLERRPGRCCGCPLKREESAGTMDKDESLMWT